MTLVDVCCADRNVNRTGRAKAQTDQEFSGTDDDARPWRRSAASRAFGVLNA